MNSKQQKNTLQTIKNATCNEPYSILFDDSFTKPVWLLYIDVTYEWRSSGNCRLEF
jgi:hypothetical protein